MPPQIKQQVTLMVRGGHSKNDNAQTDNLFRLTSPDWVSSKESEELRETIINNEWSTSGLQSTTKEQYRVALRKWLKYMLQWLMHFQCSSWQLASQDQTWFFVLQV